MEPSPHLRRITFFKSRSPSRGRRCCCFVIMALLSGMSVGLGAGDGKKRDPLLFIQRVRRGGPFDQAERAYVQRMKRERGLTNEALANYMEYHYWQSERQEQRRRQDRGRYGAVVEEIAGQGPIFRFLIMFGVFFVIVFGADRLLTWLWGKRLSQRQGDSRQHTKSAGELLLQAQGSEPAGAGSSLEGGDKETPAGQARQEE